MCDSVRCDARTPEHQGLPGNVKTCAALAKVVYLCYNYGTDEQRAPARTVRLSELIQR